MKNHKLVNGQLVKTNKTFSDLNGKQKEKISQWLYESYLKFYKENSRIPIKKDDNVILEYVFEKIDKYNIWIPEHEIKKYFFSRKNKLNKRLEKEINSIIL